jgi:pantoate--beta-alanine ligase
MSGPEIVRDPRGPEVVRDPHDWQRRCWAAREQGRHLTLVPTMGFLHEGHLSLMREARRRADQRGRGLALATVFVNPTQFGPNEDLARYPRDLAGDLAACASAGVDWVLAPERPDQMYGPDHQTWVEVERASQGLCGASRPGHFRGVATVVAKLFNLTRPHEALFGEKDWQQVQVIQAMARDLDFGVDVVAMPIVREPDGLALSSRNSYLDAEGRRRARSLSASLFAAQARAGRGERDAAALAAEARATLESAGAVVDYVAIVDPRSGRPVAQAAPGSRMLVAATVGRTRLIDNVALP